MLESFFPHGLATYLIGGLILGSGIALLYLTTGRQGGISSSFSAAWCGLLRRPFFQQAELRQSRNWRLLYALGLVLGGGLYVALGLPWQATGLPLWKFAVGGVLIGFGARLGGGCTSGHGICGMASLSPGSLGMVAVFLVTGMLTAQLLRAWGI